MQNLNFLWIMHKLDFRILSNKKFKNSVKKYKFSVRPLLSGTCEFCVIPGCGTSTHAGSDIYTKEKQQALAAACSVSAAGGSSLGSRSPFEVSLLFLLLVVPDGVLHAGAHLGCDDVTQLLDPVFLEHPILDRQLLGDAVGGIVL